MRAAGALFLLLAVAAAGATQMCLMGEAALVPGVSAPAEPWCSADDCTLRWRLSFDTATVGNQRWPLEATINGTAITSLWPALTDVGIQCSTSGEMIATTASGSGGERLRLVWTYAGVSSFSCTYMLGAIDTASDFRNFQALLAYSGHIASFDATFSSQSMDYSLASASVVCPAPASSTGALPSPSTAPSCVIGGCRYTPAQWRSQKTSPVWQAVLGREFCSIPYSDIIYSRGQAKYMPVRWLQEAQLLAAADMDAAIYGCALPIDTNAAIAASYAYISNQLNCALNVDRSDVVAALAEWTDGSAACINDKGVTTGHTHTASSGSSKEQSYLIWAIVMTVVTAVLLVLMAAVLILFARPALAQLTGELSGARSKPISAPIGARMDWWPAWFTFRDEDDDDDDEDAEDAKPLKPAAAAPVSPAPALVAAEHVPATPMVVKHVQSPPPVYASPYPSPYPASSLPYTSPVYY